MEPQLTIENVPFIWGVAFIIDVLIGISCFVLIIRRSITPWLKATVMWAGWWAFGCALSLVISMTSGPMSTFSYHQVGIFTETMLNIGLLFWCASYSFYNWHLKTDDWKKIEQLRAQLSYERQSKELREYDAK